MGFKIWFRCEQHLFIWLLFYLQESKKDWIIRTINLEGIDFVRHPKTVKELRSIDSNVQGFFNFQRALSIDAINNETKCLDINTHLLWEIPVIDEKVEELMDVLSFGGDAKYKLTMTGETKDAELSSQKRNTNWGLYSTYLSKSSLKNTLHHTES